MRPIILSVLDQALTSGLSFGLVIGLVAFTDPATVGHYAIYAASLLIAIGLHAALVTTPLNVMIPGRTPEERDWLIAGIRAADRIGIGLAAAAAALAAGLLDTWVMAPLAAALVAGALWREMERAKAIGEERMDRCLTIDAVAIGLTLPMIAVFLWIGPPVPAILAGLALGNCAGALVARRWLTDQPDANPKAYGAVWTDARWGLTGALATEAQDRGYVFLVAMLRNEAAVGILQAGRILTAPLTLTGTAWGRVARPRMTRALADGNRSGARAILVRGLLGLTALSLVVFAGLALIWPLIEAYILRGQYEGIAKITAVWALYALMVVLSTGISFYLQAEERFAELARVSIASSIVALALILPLGLGWPLMTAAWAMVVGEAVGLVWMARLAFQRDRVASR